MSAASETGNVHTPANAEDGGALEKFPGCLEPRLVSALSCFSSPLLRLPWTGTSSGSSWASVSRNRPTALFKKTYEVQARMVLAGSKGDQVAKGINELLGKFMVGFIDARSEIFFGANDRISLRRPYAMVLQLATAFLMGSGGSQCCVRSWLESCVLPCP